MDSPTKPKLVNEEVEKAMEHITKKLKTEDKNDDEAEYFEKGLKPLANEKVSKDEKEMENDFQQHVGVDISTDHSSCETNSSEIETDSEFNDNNNEKFGENICVTNEYTFEDKSAEQHVETECLNISKDPSNENDNNSLNNEDDVKEERGTVSVQPSLLLDSIKFPYKDPSTAFDVVVPLIGKNVMPVGDIKPFNHRYDLAREMNRLKALEDAPYLPKLSYEEWRKERDARSQEEKEKEEKMEKLKALQTAAYFTQIAVFILQEMQNDNPNEKIMERCFIRFLRAPASTLSLLLSSNFVHVVMYIRGSSDFSHTLRHVANQCYLKCHVMFPIPEGYNFETVYTSEVIKNIPEQLNGMRNYILDYGDFDYPDCISEDSAFEDDNAASGEK